MFLNIHNFIIIFFKKCNILKKPQIILILIPMSLLCYHMQVKKLKKPWSIQNHLTSEALKSNCSSPSKRYNLHFLKSTFSAKSLISRTTICTVFGLKLIWSCTWIHILSKNNCCSAHTTPHTSSQDSHLSFIFVLFLLLIIFVFFLLFILHCNGGFACWTI